jgi:glucan phosphorylase
LHALAEAKWKAKVRLVNSLRWQYDFDIAPEPLFDMQIKRVHEYKRQLLNILHIIHLYRELQRHPNCSANRGLLFSLAKPHLAIIWRS